MGRKLNKAIQSIAPSHLGIFRPVFVVVVVVVFIIADVVVQVRVIGAIVFVSKVTSITFSLFPPFFSTSDTDFCNVLAFYTVVAGWFGFVGISVFGLLAHSVYL